MPPNELWRHSANRSDLSFIARTRSRPYANPTAAVSVAASPSVPTRVGFHPDDTTPIPRPSSYYRRSRPVPVTEYLQDRDATQTPLSAPPLAPSASEPLPTQIDKSLLTIGEPKRLRDKAHLKFVASQACLICGRQPCDPHHLRFAQPRAIGLKVSDEFTVPLCRGHHRQLHQAGNEVAWWKKLNINALEIAEGLWKQSHNRHTPANIGSRPHLK